MTWCWLMFVALDLNRRNINRAISDDMLPELGMTTNDFNNGQTIFLLSFLAAELPSGLISKKLGPDRFIPFIITAWSIVSASQAGLKNKAGYYACRCLLGLLMGGFIPDTVSCIEVKAENTTDSTQVVYITYWYKSRELPIRLSWFVALPPHLADHGTNKSTQVLDGTQYMQHLRFPHCSGRPSNERSAGVVRMAMAVSY